MNTEREKLKLFFFSPLSLCDLGREIESISKLLHFENSHFVLFKNIQ